MQTKLGDLLIRVPLKERWRRIQVGLKAPKETPEYRYAKDALFCMFGPSTMSMIGSTLIACGSLFIEVESSTKAMDIAYTVEIVEPTETKLDDLKIEEAKPEEIKPPEPIDQNMDPNLAPGVTSEITTPGPPQEFSSGDTGVGNGVGGDMDTPVVPFAVVMTKSPVIMKGLYGNRTKGGREVALRAYGGGGGGGGGYTEGAVMRALRWLKKNQQADGSWNKVKPAMTGLAVLTYLAHGETPSSDEFGPTVEKGIKWLVDNQEQDGRFKGRDGGDYSLPIATYAICESYGMIKLPLLKTVAEKGIDIIIKGQHPSGGWNYKCGPGTENHEDDTSYMGWCAQALKAAKMAGLENEGLSEAMKHAVSGFKKNASPSGGFGYCSPGAGGLTGVGVLCMQLLGAAREAECRNGVLWLEKSCTFDWEKPWLASPIYYWYYVTQTKFHSGGDIWNKWNKQFAVQLVKNQQIEKEAIDGPKGKKYDIGWWEPPADVKGHSDGPVMDTTLCTLQLEVYYRYLPTFKPPVQEGEEDKPESDDIEIKVTPAPAK